MIFMNLVYSSPLPHFSTLSLSVPIAVFAKVLMAYFLNVAIGVKP